MNISLDYDGTYTSDPELWLEFVKNAKSRGHFVFIVTMRYPSEVFGGKIDPRLFEAGIAGVVPTSRQAKEPYCDEADIKIDIWIDDNPKAVNLSAKEIWDDDAPEGHVIVPNYN